ncbi:MAG: dCTP deaminase, partial [Nanoarchaeota archaeon]|nr:dCTP deaminase [Nanoarchaeota archaeon]
MILTKKEILKKIQNKQIIISPFDKNSIGPASIDLMLDNELRIFTKNNAIVPVTENIDYKKLTKIVKIDKGHILKPGELVIGLTKET